MSCKKWKLEKEHDTSTHKFKDMLKKCKSKSWTKEDCTFFENTSFNPLTGRKISSQKTKDEINKKCYPPKKQGICEQWNKNKLVNPRTNRKIKKGAKIYNKLEEECSSSKKKSPKKVESPKSKSPKKVESPKSKSPKKVESPKKKSPKKVESSKSKSPKKVELPSLDKMNLVALRALAKERGIRGCYKMKKEQILELLGKKEISYEEELGELEEITEENFSGDVTNYMKNVVDENRIKFKEIKNLKEKDIDLIRDHWYGLHNFIYFLRNISLLFSHKQPLNIGIYFIKKELREIAKCYEENVDKYKKTDFNLMDIKIKEINEFINKKFKNYNELDKALFDLDI